MNQDMTNVAATDPRILGFDKPKRKVASPAAKAAAQDARVVKDRPISRNRYRKLRKRGVLR